MSALLASTYIYKYLTYEGFFISCRSGTNLSLINWLLMFLYISLSNTSDLKPYGDSGNKSIDVDAIWEKVEEFGGMLLIFVLKLPCKLLTDLIWRSNYCFSTVFEACVVRFTFIQLGYRGAICWESDYFVFSCFYCSFCLSSSASIRPSYDYFATLKTPRPSLWLHYFRRATLSSHSCRPFVADKTNLIALVT